MITTVKWTIEDYHNMIDAGILSGRQVELIKGEIIEMAPEREPHAYSSDEAGEYLAYILGERAKVRHAKPITLPNGSEPEPDIAVVERLGREYRNHHPYPENIYWLIEYSNTTLEKDLKVKSKAYAEVNIQEYWVVDLKKLHLIVFRQPINGEYTIEQTLTAGIIQPLSFPSISVSVDKIING